MKEREVSLSDQDKAEVELMKACKDATDKDSRFVSFSRQCSSLFSSRCEALW